MKDHFRLFYKYAYFLKRFHLFISRGLKFWNLSIFNCSVSLNRKKLLFNETNKLFYCYCFQDSVSYTTSFFPEKSVLTDNNWRHLFWISITNDIPSIWIPGCLSIIFIENKQFHYWYFLPFWFGCYTKSLSKENISGNISQFFLLYDM